MAKHIKILYIFIFSIFTQSLILAFPFSQADAGPGAPATQTNTSPNSTSSGTTTYTTTATKQTAVGNPPVTGTCPSAAPADIIGALKQDGFIVTGLTSDTRGMSDLYNAICRLKQSTKFISLLHANTQNITISLEAPSATSHGGSCFGHADGNTNILILYGYTCYGYINGFVVTHELGHFVNFRNVGLYNQWFSSTYPSGQTMPTWDCQLDYGPGPWPAECWADMIGEYVWYKEWREALGGGRNTSPPGDEPFTEFPTVYSTYYNFAKTYIFGGVVY